jgi:hypothetical protein
VSEWVVETLLEKRLTLGEALEAIRDGATNEIGKRTHHDFLVGGFQHGKPWAVRITNCELRPDYLSVPPLSKFEISGVEVTEPMAFWAGAIGLVTAEDIQTIRQAATANAALKDVRQLLAAVNRRAARSTHPHAHLVSEGCVSVSLDPDGVMHSEVFHWKPHPERQPAVPSVWFGVDTTTPDALPGLLAGMLEIESGTPEAKAEAERAITDWVNARSAELRGQRQRLHRPKK